jgi:hypothetical protein
MERIHLALNMLHWWGLTNTALDVRGTFRGVKHFELLQGCWIPKENMRLAVHEGTWILLLQYIRLDGAL